MLVCWVLLGDKLTFIFSYSRGLKQNISPYDFHLSHLSLISFAYHFIFPLIIQFNLTLIIAADNHSCQITQINYTLLFRKSVLHFIVQIKVTFQSLTDKQNSWRGIFGINKVFLVTWNTILIIIYVNDRKFEVYWANAWF